ncbi:MAG: MmcB family DNA repair protein [Pseudomonadota bacterium]
MRPSNDRKLAPARRKALTLRFARQAARKAFVPQ